MAISIKKSSSENKQTVTSSLSPEVQTQITNNLKLDTTDYTVPAQPSATAGQSALKETVTSAGSLPQEQPKGKRTDDVVQLKFSKGKRAEAKAFYSAYDLKMNAGFEMAYEFLKEEVTAGRVKLSKSGIQRIN
ncbi:hypothetical protein [uncultured Treponema sp.]|uniref:hypothetical protein n=1 Tax=uncultured Treponema sp. TaxID=162155 RepID=UPI0015C1532B|nr:hypothetical protein [uncultured Treponema sp.]